jgi:hypothetical protein
MMKTWIGPPLTGSGSGFIDEFATPTSISSPSARLCAQKRNAKVGGSLGSRYSTLGIRVRYGWTVLCVWWCVRRPRVEGREGCERGPARLLACYTHIIAGIAEACSAAGCIYLALHRASR